MEDVLFLLDLLLLVIVQFLDEGPDHGVVSGKGDEEGWKDGQTYETCDHHPHDETIRHHHEHEGEDSHQDHEHWRIRITLLWASLDEVRSAGSPTEGQQGDRCRRHDHRRKVAGAKTDRHLLDGLGWGV